MDQQEAERGGSGRRVGEELAAARVAQGLSLADIAARTRVPQRTLEMLEAGTTAGLPALTYSAGFVRSYGDMLGLDGTDLARRFRVEMGRLPPPPVPAAYEVADPAHVPTRLLAIVALVVAVLIAGAYAVWRGDGLFGGGAEDRARLAAGTAPGAPVVVPPAPAPVAGIATAPLRPLVAGGPVVVTATREVWLRISDRAGDTLFSGTMAPGQRFEVPAAAADPVLRTGRAQAVAVTVGGAAMPPLGPPDTLIRDVSLKRDALLALAQPAASAAPAPPMAGMAATRANP